MAIAYESHSAATVDNSGTLVITKPTGLAVGDLMVAGIWGDRDGGTSAVPDTASGWTSVRYLNTGTSNGFLSVQTKTADSGDVAASNFTFTATGTTSQMHLCGFIVRVSGYGNTAGEANATSGSTSSTLTITGFTPSPAITSALYILFAGRAFAGSGVGISSVAMATSNPTWTEREENGVNGSTTDSQFALYTATRTESTATGDFTVTYATTDNTRSGSVVLALNPSISGSVTPTTTVYAYTYTPVQSAKLLISGDTPEATTRRQTMWTEETKNTTTWTEENT